MSKFMFRSLLTLLLIAPGSSFAKEAMADMFSGAGYGLAGCGLGSIVFGAKEGPVQIIAATVNGTFGSQTFGITSGTSNCDIPRMGQQAAVFIEVNKEVLRKEASMGQGESVDAVAMILKCDSSKVSAELKGNFNYYLGSDVDSYETVRRILNSSSCSTQKVGA